MFEMQSAQMRHSGGYVVPVEDANALGAEGLTSREITRLMKEQSRFKRGESNQETLEYERFRFALWHYQHSQHHQIKG